MVSASFPDSYRDNISIIPNHPPPTLFSHLISELISPSSKQKSRQATPQPPNKQATQQGKQTAVSTILLFPTLIFLR